MTSTMETQNNNIGKPQEKDLSIGVKIVLLIGVFFAAVSATLMICSVFSFSKSSLLIWGTIFFLGSLALSRVDRPEIRFSLVVPFYISGTFMIGAYLTEMQHMEFSHTSIIMSIMAIPVMLFSRNGMLKHLAIAQGIWMIPFWFEMYQSSDIILSICSIVVYAITVLAEKKISQNSVVASELRTLRIVLLIMVMVLMAWIDFGFGATNDGTRSVLTSIVLLPLTFWAADRAGLTMSILYLIYSLSIFYYNYELDLLHKSLFLMASGVILLALSYGIKRFCK